MSKLQFQGIPDAEFTVDEVTDPNGAPAEVIDLAQGFVVKGTVTLPNWLTGEGHVVIYADEVGGPIDRSILEKTVPVAADPAAPNPKPYKWEVSYPADCPDPSQLLPDPAGGSPLYHLAAVFTFGDPSTNIGGFVEMGPYMLT